MLQALDRLRNGLPVGQRAAQPAVVHVELRAALGRFGDGLLGLTLGADNRMRPPLATVSRTTFRAWSSRGTVWVRSMMGCRCGHRRCTRPCGDSSGRSGGRSERQLPAADAWRTREEPCYILFRFEPRCHRLHPCGQPVDRTGFLPASAPTTPVKWRAYRRPRAGAQAPAVPPLHGGRGFGDGRP